MRLLKQAIRCFFIFLAGVIFAANFTVLYRPDYAGEAYKCGVAVLVGLTFMVLVLESSEES
jgi:hypothetical protein